MSLDYAILGFLKQEAATGYELKTRCFSGGPATFWTADQAQIYRTLTRLETQKLIASKRIRQASRPDRITYSLTPKGNEALMAWLKEPQPTAPPRDSFALSLLFSDDLTPEELHRLYLSRREEHCTRLSALREHIQKSDKDASLKPHTRRAQIDAYTYLAAQERAAIDCLDDAIERLEIVRKGA